MLGRLKMGGERDDRGWDGWIASPTQWTWVWASSRSLWWTGRPGVLQSMGLQRVGHDWATELTDKSVVGINAPISWMGKPRFKGVNVTCPRWHNWVNFRYLCKSWILTLANLDDGGPTILSVIYPSSLQPGPGFIPVVSLLILDSWAQVLQIFPYSTSFLFYLFHDPPPTQSFPASINLRVTKVQTAPQFLQHFLAS